MSGIVYPNTMFYKECYKILSQPGYVSYIVAPFLSSPLPASSPPSPASAFTTSSSATSSSSHWQWSLFLQKLLTSEINSLFQHCLLCITSFSTSGVIAMFIWCSSKAYSIFNTLRRDVVDDQQSINIHQRYKYECGTMLLIVPTLQIGKANQQNSSNMVFPNQKEK